MIGATILILQLVQAVRYCCLWVNLSHIQLFDSPELVWMIKDDGCHRGIGSCCGLDLYSLSLYQCWN
ncbi:hypothetical protein WN944_000371 [Citrus x changshan-huyou]|uniref:Uncharacterized protein n=1 Tax=Citrus x changshan-huyou TaxID=2935761 RepID=A0AAP0MCR7_9ROSI